MPQLTAAPLRRLSGRLSGLIEASRFVRSRSGQALVETALVLPIFTIGLLGGAEFARALSVQGAVTNAARAGAEGYAVNQSLTEADVRCYAQQELNRTAGVTATGYCSGETVPTCSAAYCIQTWGVTADYTVGTPPVKYIKVEVRYTYQTIITWPGILRNVYLDRTTIMGLPG